MKTNPILEELWAIRQQMLDEVDGDHEELIRQIQARELSSGRVFATPGTTSRFGSRIEPNVTSGEGT